MDYTCRKELIKKIESKRGRPLIAYVTSIRPGCGAQMTQEMIPEFIKHINKIEKKDARKGIDLLIISYGGDPIVSWRIISLLREKFNKIGVLIPFTAYSAATLLSLGADEILMHPFGNLGPLDPQINIHNPDGSVKIIGYEDITKYLEFVRDAGITDQELIQKSFDKLTNEINPTVIGFAKRSSQLGLSMGEKLLGTHMEDKGKAKAISETLNTKFYNHGYPLGKKEAKEIGLKVVDVDKELEDLMWQLYESYMEEFQFNQNFDPNTKLADELSKIVDPDFNKQYTFFENTKIISIESSKLNSYIENNMVINCVIREDTSISSNVMINSGSWITDDTEEENNVNNQQ